MRVVFAALALSALLSSGGDASRSSMTQKEALDLFFSSLGTRQQFADSVRAMGVTLDGDLSERLTRVLTPPWARPSSNIMRDIQGAVDDSLDTLIDTLRRLIETVAEPLKIEEVSLNRSDPLVQSVGYIRDASISQLSTFKIENLKVDALAAKGVLKVSFDRLDAHGTYSVDATASGQLHVFGDGNFNVRLYQPTVEVDAELDYKDKHFSIKNLKIGVKLGKLKVLMSNLLGGGEVGDLVCGIVSDVGPAFLDEYHSEVSRLLSTEVKDTANALLAKVDINAIIDALTGGEDSH